MKQLDIESTDIPQESIVKLDTQQEPQEDQEEPIESEPGALPHLNILDLLLNDPLGLGIRILGENYARALYINYESEEQKPTQPTPEPQQPKLKNKTIYIGSGNHISDQTTNNTIRSGRYYDAIRARRLDPDHEVAFVRYTGTSATKCKESEFHQPETGLPYFPQLLKAYQIAFRLAKEAKAQGFTPRIVCIANSYTLPPGDMPRLLYEIIRNAKDDVQINHIEVGEYDEISQWRTIIELMISVAESYPFPNTFKYNHVSPSSASDMRYALNNIAPIAT